MDLAEVHQELVPETRHTMAQIADGPRIAALGGLFDEIIAQFEALALCHLLEHADEGEYRENLARCGHARRYFLRRSKVDNNDDDRHLALSRNHGVLAALAAGSFPLARDIALLSTEVWRADWEYEDDYCYYLFLHSILKQPDPFPTLETGDLLDRFEGALEGGESLHFNVVKAITARDAEAAGAAIVALLDAEKAKNDRDRASAKVLERDITFWPRSRVSVEGLALLKVCEVVRLPAVVDHPLCPRPARLAWDNRTFRDLFEELRG